MRLVIQICLLCLACVLIPTTLLTAVFSYFEANYSYAQLRDEQRLLAVTIASQVESGYHEQNWPFQMLWAIAGKPEFVFWQVADGDHRTVLEHGDVDPAPAAWEGVLKGPYATQTADGRTEEWVVPLQIGSVAKPWTYRLGFRADQIRDHIRGVVVTNTLVAAAMSVFLVGLSLLLARRIVAPVRSLTVVAKELEHGNLEASLPTASNEETMQLVSAFRSMAAGIRERDVAIKAHLESLEASKGDLERRVRERTDDLVSANRKLEETSLSLQENEARMRAIVEHAADGIVTTSEDGRIELFNPTAKSMFGFDASEILGESVSRLLAEGFSIGSGAQILRADRDGVRGLGRSAEVVCRRKNGELFPARISLSEMTVASRPLFTAIVSDISERRRAEEERREMNDRLVAASRSAGMAEMATSVLHNVGNVLTSVSVSATVLADAVRHSNVSRLGKVAALLNAHAGDLARFISEDPAGKTLPLYLTELARSLSAEQGATEQELLALLANVDHVKSVVKMQQTFARRGSSVAETVRLDSLISDALRICASALDARDVEVTRDLSDLPEVVVDRHRIIQVLVNLVTNAAHALEGRNGARRLRLETRPEGDSDVSIRVTDNGVGIARENLVKIFTHGFTTRDEGHGFGLHSSATSAMEIGGTLVAESDGLGEGATFILTFPRRPRETLFLEGSTAA